MPTVSEQLEILRDEIIDKIHEFEEDNQLVICALELESPQCTHMTANIQKNGHRLWIVLKH